MFVVTGGRGSGKTEAIVRWLHEDPGSRCVLVANEDRRRYILGRLHSGSFFGTVISFDWRPHVISAKDHMFGGHMRGHANPFHFPQVAVDDMEDVFRVIFGATLEFATMSATWIPLSPNPDVVKAEVVETKELRSGEGVGSKFTPDIVVNVERPPTYGAGYEAGFADGKSRRGFRGE